LFWERILSRAEFEAKSQEKSLDFINKEHRMKENKEDILANNAITLTTGLLLVFSIAFFLYYGLNTMNDPVFSIDFVPYHLAGRLLAQNDLKPLTNYAETGGFFATSGPFFDYFHQYFYPDTSYATRWVYLPAYLWIFRPFAKFDFPAASRIWLAVNVILTLICFWLLWSARRLPSLSPRIKSWRLVWYVFIMLTFQPVFSNLWHGQVTALIFACFCLFYWLFRREYKFLAGFVLGVIVPFKFYPALFVFYFIWRREWRLVAGVGAAGLALMLVSLFTVGWEGNLAYFQIVVSELGGGGIPAFNNQSISGFLLHTFTKGNVFAWLDVEVPVWLSGLRFATVLLLVGVVAWSIQRPTSTNIKANDVIDLDLSLIIYVMLLASPITWYHYFMWLLFPLVVLFDQYLLEQNLGLRQIGWLVLAYGLVVFEGVIVLRPIAEQALQNTWLLRMMLSQGLFGVMILFGLSLKSRLKKTQPGSDLIFG
jgi:alpha-1,2-mannosyltransferase